MSILNRIPLPIAGFFPANPRINR